jgi:RNA polymerase sigma factor (sigma-70 family)
VPEGEVAALVRAASRGSDEAWNLLFARFGDLVWGVARAHGLSHCDASDVAQTVWLRLYQRLGRLTQPERVGAWLSTTTRRECLRLLREQQRQVPSALVEQLAREMAPAVDEIELADDPRADSRRFWAAYARLPAHCQLILRMLVAEPGSSYQAVSEAMDMPPGSVGPTRARCLERLRANLLYPDSSEGENGGEQATRQRALGSGRRRSAEEVS